jgi:hypothetical protein
MSNKRIIYILCPGHSGSTLIEYYLSCYPKSIGIGEAYKAIAAFQKGEIDRLSEYDRKKIEEIPFWQKMAQSAKKYNGTEEHYLEMYKYILTSDEFADYDIIIDSSKTMDGFKILEKHFGDILDVVLVFKDVRSWIISQIDNNIRKERKIPVGYAYRLVLKWYKSYYFLLKNLNKMQKRHTAISYDLFCLNQAVMENHIRESLQLPGKPDFSNTNSINILGNRMKKEANLGLEIKYDYRWMHRNEWNRPWIWLPGKFKRYNYDHVWKTGSQS